MQECLAQNTAPLHEGKLSAGIHPKPLSPAGRRGLSVNEVHYAATAESGPEAPWRGGNRRALALSCSICRSGCASEVSSPLPRPPPVTVGRSLQHQSLPLSVTSCCACLSCCLLHYLLAVHAIQLTLPSVSWAAAACRCWLWH